MQDAIFDKVKTLQNLVGVKVLEGNQGKGTIYINSKRKHEFNMMLGWNQGRYLVFFLDEHGDKIKPAAMSLFDELDAIMFVSTYLSIHQLRARRKK